MKIKSSSLNDINELKGVKG